MYMLGAEKVLRHPKLLLGIRCSIHRVANQRPEVCYSGKFILRRSAL
jgi:hypothetical protein